MADQKDMICWERASTFSIGVQLKTPGGRVHSPSEELIELDTGYEGEVLVPYDLYVEMELYGWEYPEIFWATGRTVSGEILHMPLSYGYLVIPRWGRFQVETGCLSDKSSDFNLSAGLREGRLSGSTFGDRR